MKSNYMWVIEAKIGKRWISFATSRLIVGVHHTRAKARKAIKDYKDRRSYKTSVQFRVRKYEAVK